MKKTLTLIISIILCCILESISAKTITLLAGANVGTTLAAATTASGDIIELSQEGTYLWNAQASIGNGTTSVDPKSITIRAAAGLTTRPIIQCQAATSILSLALYKTNGSEIVLDGIDFDGNSKVSYIWTVKSYNTTSVSPKPTFNIKMNNCVVRNLAPTSSSAGLAYAFSYSNSAPVTAPGFLAVSNTKFESITTAALYANGAGKPDSVNFTNCYFKGVFAKAAIHNSDGLVAGQVRKFVINHCTFDGGNSSDLNLVNIAADAASSTTISNCIFANNTGNTANVLGTGGNFTAKCAVWNAANAATVYPTAVTDGVISTDPIINSNGVATGTDYVTNGTDGKTIGYYTELNTGNLSNVTCNDLFLTQNGLNFKLNTTSNSAYAVYSLCGCQIAEGNLLNGGFVLNIKSGIYLLKTNTNVLKFIVR